MAKDHRPQGSYSVPLCQGQDTASHSCAYSSNELGESDHRISRYLLKSSCSCNCLQLITWTNRRKRRCLASRRYIMSTIGVKLIAAVILCSSLIFISVLYHKRNAILSTALQQSKVREIPGTVSNTHSFVDNTMRNSTHDLKDPMRTAATASATGKKKIKSSSLGRPFNPELFDNSTVGSKKYVIIYWSKIRGFKARIQSKKEYEGDAHIWPYTYAGDSCPVHCELTNDRSRAAEASGFVVHSRLTDVWDLPPLQYLAPWILQNNENPVYTPALSDRRIMSKFNLLMSYRLDSDFPSPIYPMPSLDPPIPFSKRLGNVLAVFSKCEPVRTEYMRQLMKYIDVHSYGACLKNKKGLIGLYSQINGKYVFKDYKFVMSRYYKFSLVFMNQDCDYFIDDRLYHALETGSIPVYMGTDLVDQFLPGNLKNSIIKVSDFDGPKDLANYLHYLSNNETAYNKYLEWKWKGIGDYKNTTIGRWWDQKYPLFCQVCMKLSQGNLHPGLDVDQCEPRRYDRWGLEPPYPKTFKKVRQEPEINEQFFMYWKPLFVVGIVFGTLVVLMNCCVRCTVDVENQEKVQL